MSEQRLLGILGGMSWESTASYYAGINRGVQQARGGLHSARLLLHSVDFAPIAAMQQAGQWQQAAQQLGKVGRKLAEAGAGALLLASNTMHKLVDDIVAEAGIPLLHICDPMIAALRQSGVSQVGLLATRFTMEDHFYRQRLEQAGITVCVPAREARDLVHRVIFEELCRGEIRPESRSAFAGIADDLAEAGAQGVILGCTEIGMLLSPKDTCLPQFDSASLHIAAAVDWLLAAD